jgi:beta-N-acetylhexosaminidase
MQQLMHSFEGRAAPPAILEAVQRGEIAAFCLFAGLNVDSPGQLRELTESLRQAAQHGGHLPPLIGIDQEGGQLIAVTGGATELPGNMALGATRSAALAEQAGRVLGLELLAMGLNMNFAPSLDVNVNPANPVIGTRSFGDDPALVATLGTALIRGLQSTGVLAAAKHFPGHGDTSIDTHDSLPVIAHSLERINAVELVPFRAAIQAGVDAIITAHILFSALDNVNVATLSPMVLDRFLRRELGFKGLIITDAMDMRAVAQRGRIQSVSAALQAGVDLVLLGHMTDQLALIEAMRPLVRPDAVARIQTAQAKAPLSLPSPDVIGCAEHRQIAQTIADQSITLVRDSGCLPLRPAPGTSIAVITPHPMDLTPADTSSAVRITLAEAVARRHRNVQAYELPHQATDEAISAILQATAQADVIIMGTISAERDPGQVALIRALIERGQMPIVAALRTPYDLVSLPRIETYLCAYGIRPVTMEAVARVLFGEIEARGILPCAIPGLAANSSKGT